MYTLHDFSSILYDSRGTSLDLYQVEGFFMKKILTSKPERAGIKQLVSEKNSKNKVLL
jgi:hypothetical protein